MYQDFTLEPRPPHSHTPPTPPTTHTTTIPDHLHEMMMRGGGQGWVCVKTLCFQGVGGFLKNPKFRPLFRILFGIFFHKTGLQTWNKSSLWKALSIKTAWP